MIKHYVASTMPQQHNIRSANPRLDEIQIKQHMALDLEKHFSSQLVLLYYVLSHQDAAHSEHSEFHSTYSLGTPNNPVKIAATFSQVYQQLSSC